MVFIPFADFGPLTVTTNADVFKERINRLSATGGGRYPRVVLVWTAGVSKKNPCFI